MKLIKASLISNPLIVFIDAEQFHVIRKNPEADLSVQIFDKEGKSLGFVPPSEVIVDN